MDKGRAQAKRESESGKWIRLGRRLQKTSDWKVHEA